MTAHTPTSCTGCRFEGHCPICDGGLVTCTVCGASEGELPKECPGARMAEHTRQDVLEGRLDFINGQWVSPVSSQQPAPQPLSAAEALARVDDYLEEGMPRLAATLQVYARQCAIVEAAHEYHAAEMHASGVYSPKMADRVTDADRSAAVKRYFDASTVFAAALAGEPTVAHYGAMEKLRRVAHAARALRSAQEDYMAVRSDPGVPKETKEARGAIVGECAEAVDLALANASEVM